MKIKIAILTGVLLWVLIFFEVSLLMFGLKLQGTLYYTIHYILLVLLIAIPALVYFKKAKGNFTEGLLLGIVFIIIGMILDFIITIPLFIKDYSFLIRWDILVGSLEILVVTTIVGMFRK